MVRNGMLILLFFLLSFGLPDRLRAQAAQPAPPAAAAPAPSPEQQLYGEYIRWMAGQPVAARGPNLLETYRQHLAAQGLPAAEIERRLTIIRDEGQRLEVDRWNRYFTAERPRFNPMPNVFLAQVVEGRTPGMALDVGMGQGRNAVWLARQGWKVTGFDPADQAVALARKNAEALGLSLDAIVARDDTFDFGENKWDLIVLSYVGCGQWADRIERALKPGGIVVAEAFHADAARKFPIGGSICETGQLPATFKQLRAIRYEEPMGMPDFATARMRIVRFAAERPVEP